MLARQASRGASAGARRSYATRGTRRLPPLPAAEAVSRYLHTVVSLVKWATWVHAHTWRRTAVRAAPVPTPGHEASERQGALPGSAFGQVLRQAARGGQALAPAAARQLPAAGVDARRVVLHHELPRACHVRAESMRRRPPRKEAALVFGVCVRHGDQSGTFFTSNLADAA